MAVDIVMMIASARRLMAVLFIAGGFVMQMVSIIIGFIDCDTVTDMYFLGCALAVFGVFLLVVSLFI